MLAVLRVLAVVPLAVFVTGCGLIGGSPTLPQHAPEVIRVSSPIAGSLTLPRRYTCRGHGISPPLAWSGVPRTARSLALVVDDANAPITPRVYWIVYDMSPSRTDIQAGSLPPGARQAMNSFGRVGYDVPCPRPGDHKYRFTIYALNAYLRLRDGARLIVAWSEIAAHTIARGRVTLSATP